MILNKHLPKILKENNIKRWFPRQYPSIEYHRSDKRFEICYYHNNDIHKIVYETLEDSEFIMAPNLIIETKLNKRYYSYGFKSGDEYMYAEE